MKTQYTKSPGHFLSHGRITLAPATYRALIVGGAALSMLLAVSACERPARAPSPEQHAALLADAPEIFLPEISEPHRDATLADIGEIYLGQDSESALLELEKLCPKTMEYRAGDVGENAWFRGCVLKKPVGGLLSVRVGFWPKLSDRVATLDIKRDDISLDQARERFREFATDLSADYPHPGLVEMRGEKYQMMANTDEGSDGPTHIAFGYTHKWANKHK